MQSRHLLPPTPVRWTTSRRRWNHQTRGEISVQACFRTRQWLRSHTHTPVRKKIRFFFSCDSRRSSSKLDIPMDCLTAAASTCFVNMIARTLCNSRAFVHALDTFFGVQLPLAHTCQSGIDFATPSVHTSAQASLLTNRSILACSATTIRHPKPSHHTPLAICI